MESELVTMVLSTEFFVGLLTGFAGKNAWRQAVSFRTGMMGGGSSSDNSSSTQSTQRAQQPASARSITATTSNARTEQSRVAETSDEDPRPPSGQTREEPRGATRRMR